MAAIMQNPAVRLVGPSARCVGLNVSAPRPSFTTVGQHTMANIPGGDFVMGSKGLDIAPHWMQVEPFLMGTTVVTEGQYRNIMGDVLRSFHSNESPITALPWFLAENYYRRHGHGLRFPTEAEWEFAARGPAVNMRELMEEENGVFRSEDFTTFVADRFENFVLDVGSTIFLDPMEEPFQRLLNGSAPIYGWRVYGTPSGRLTDEEVRNMRKGETDAYWGPANAYGLKGMTGGVWEWVKDRCDYFPFFSRSIDITDYECEKILRGGSHCYRSDHISLRAANHIRSRLHDFSCLEGIRVAASLPR